MNSTLYVRASDRRRELRSLALWGVLITALVASVGCSTRHNASASDAAVRAVVLAPAPIREAGPTYRIQQGDELDVKYLHQPELNVHVPVRPDGRISLPAAGEIAVVGMTPTDLERLVVERTARRLRNPEVTIVVTKLGEQRVYIGGEVARPGYVTLRDELTPLQAVLQTGGFRTTAKLDSVLLLTPGADGKFSAARMDMEQVVSFGVAERVRLRPNDVVYVPRTWIADADIFIDQWVRGLVPALPRVGVGYSLGN